MPRCTLFTVNRQMWTISVDEWKTALTAILKELDNPQCDKMLEIVQIPKQRKTAKFREQLPPKIIEYHGLERSIRKIRDAMDQIPRRDQPVQKLLLPFVEQLKNGPKTGGKKRKRGEGDSKSADKEPEVGQWKSFQPDKRTPESYNSAAGDLQAEGSQEIKGIKRVILR
ncbi:uncharacterized protein LOC120442181 [Oreochromis aureus]|uniref:uncharacterized protein LOC120442181 n=1 Tax=Oreochromis aureus TaxID=47969 RepID=UPI001953D3D9|nr:uncharacterized protein LOC120442181 [Oreochromis aureus]